MYRPFSDFQVIPRPTIAALLLGLLICSAAIPAPAADNAASTTPSSESSSDKLITTTIETSTLPPIVGQEDLEHGTRIESVEKTQDGKAVKIYVTMPRSQQSDLEEVIVLGKPDKKKKRATLQQLQKFEVVNNLEQGRSGIIIYLGKQEDFALKLNYTEPRPDVEPDVFNRD